MRHLCCRFDPRAATAIRLYLRLSPFVHLLGSRYPVSNLCHKAASTVRAVRPCLSKAASDFFSSADGSEKTVGRGTRGRKWTEAICGRRRQVSVPPSAGLLSTSSSPTRWATGQPLEVPSVGSVHRSPRSQLEPGCRLMKVPIPKKVCSIYGLRLPFVKKVRRLR